MCHREAKPTTVSKTGLSKKKKIIILITSIVLRTWPLLVTGSHPDTVVNRSKVCSWPQNDFRKVCTKFQGGRSGRVSRSLSFNSHRTGTWEVTGDG